MSYLDYEMSKRIAAEDHSFYALIMAAMRQANTDKLEALKRAFPNIYEELVYRDNSPGGIHPMDGRMARLIIEDLAEIEDDDIG